MDRRSFFRLGAAALVGAGVGRVFFDLGARPASPGMLWVNKGMALRFIKEFAITYDRESKLWHSNIGPLQIVRYVPPEFVCRVEG